MTQTHLKVVRQLVQVLTERLSLKSAILLSAVALVLRRVFSAPEEDLHRRPGCAFDMGMCESVNGHAESVDQMTGAQLITSDSTAQHSTA